MNPLRQCGYVLHVPTIHVVSKWMIEPLAEAHEQTLKDWKEHDCVDALPQRVVNDPTYAPESVEHPVVEKFLSDRAENLRELDRYEMRNVGVYDRKRGEEYAGYIGEERPRDVRECMRGLDFSEREPAPPVFTGPSPP